MHVSTVSSSNILAVAYDPGAQRLAVQFHSQRAWTYEGVPPHTYRALMQAGSKGSYFSRQIRGRFQNHELPPAEVATIFAGASAPTPIAHRWLVSILAQARGTNQVLL